MTETTLIEAAIRGDLASFNQLVIDYQDMVFNHALWILKDDTAAEDITQDTFIQAYKNLAHYRGGSFRAWMMRIVTNACYDELRRQKRHPSISLAHTDTDGEEIETEEWLIDRALSVEEKFEQGELRMELQRYLDELPVEYREILWMIDILEFSYEEAANSLMIPIGTVKSRLARARLGLRKRLEKYPDLLPGEDSS